MEKTADTELLEGNTHAGTESQEPPYPPSWVDRVTDWVRHLPVPAWSFYSVLALALVLADAAVNWSNGSYLTSSSLPFHLMSFLTPAINMAMIHYFDDWAGTALATFRPALAVDEVEYKDLHYRLTTLPRLQTLVASFIGLAYGSIYVFFLYNSRIDPLRVFTLPVASVLDVTMALLNYIFYSILIYHTFHQLRMVSWIYTECKQVDLFQLSPLHALSTFTARVSITIGALTYAWIYVFSTSGDILGILTPIVAVPLLFATFIVPLLGIHNILREEKTLLQSENALHLKAAIRELHLRREAGEYGQMDGVGKAIDALVKEQTLLKEIPTWPWQPDTARWVATALLTPIILALVTRLVQRLLGI